MSTTLSANFTCKVGVGAEAPHAFARDVDAGLGAPRKAIPGHHFYDARGSELFAEITRQPEYYLTAAETGILRTHADDIAAAGSARQTLIELGPGCGDKASVLVEAILRRQGTLEYQPIDLSETALRHGAAVLLRSFPGLTVNALAARFEEGLASIFATEPAPALIAFLGSSIGNLHRNEAFSLLSRVRRHARPFDLFLIGFDLQKDDAVVTRAYNDAAGATARFNLNLLRRINRELGGRFSTSHFEHAAFYDAAAGRVEMHLRSTEDQLVRVESLDRYFSFEEGETIWTESAYKYSFRQIAELCALSGWAALHHWTDDAGRFADVLLAPAPNRGLIDRPLAA